MREQISLNGTWQLKGTASYVPLRDKSMETGKPLEGVTGWMDGTRRFPAAWRARCIRQAISTTLMWT